MAAARRLPVAAAVHAAWTAASVAVLGAASSARAEWQEVATARDGTRYFVDPATLEKTGETTRRIQVMVNRRSPAVEGWRSAIGLEEFECSGEQRRIWSARFYSDDMGQGEQTGSLANLLEWKVVALGSAQRAQLRFTCELK